LRDAAEDVAAFAGDDAHVDDGGVDGGADVDDADVVGQTGQAGAVDPVGFGDVADGLEVDGADDGDDAVVVVPVVVAPVVVGPVVFVGAVVGFAVVAHDPVGVGRPDVVVGVVVADEVGVAEVGLLVEPVVVAEVAGDEVRIVVDGVADVVAGAGFGFTIGTSGTLFSGRPC
jgi:hypothetical protein